MKIARQFIAGMKKSRVYEVLEKLRRAS